MALYTTLASLSQTAASNVADGSVDAPSTIDQQTNLLASFIAQLRDGSGLTTGVGYLGQCRLVKSGSNLVLQRYNGLGLTINGVAYAIPSAGVSLAPTSLSVGTTYYIYAYMNAGTMTLEASATAHATDTATGIEIKSGDATRTLVGMARIITGPAWQDTTAQRYVLSWFNRKPVTAVNSFSGNAGPSNTTTPVELNGSARAEFLCWGSDTSVVNSNILVNPSGVVVAISYIGIDGSSAATVVGHVQGVAGGSNGTVTPNGVISPAEGYHYLTIYGYNNAAVNTTWLSTSNVSVTVNG